jgi:hypothetical protein
VSSPKRVLKRLSFSTFRLLDRFGVHVLPKHYYTPISDYAWLRRNPHLWQRPLSMRGIHWDLDAQLQWLTETCNGWYEEAIGAAERHAIGPGFGRIEAQVLHCFVRKQAPLRIVEVGGGTSTATMAAASALNVREGRQPSRITSIDPFPAAGLERLGGVHVRAEYGQAVGLPLFQELAAGDLLFIDSTHALKTSSEVSWLYLEVIPALASGVYVHVHDVFLPYLYRPTLLSEYFDWQETALLTALLIGNASLRVLCCQSALHHAEPEKLTSILRDYRPEQMTAGLAASRARGDSPASIWITTL